MSAFTAPDSFFTKRLHFSICLQLCFHLQHRAHALQMLCSLGEPHPHSATHLLDMEQKDLRDLISCPICFNYCTGKIYNCANGHVTCSECIKSINKCPTCRVKMAPASRNIALEQVLSTVLFPCKFAEAGCEALVPHSQLGEHQENCRHSRVPHICSHCNRDCGYEESRKTHLDLCPDNLLMCHHCEEFVARKDLPCHLWMKHSKPFQVRTCVTCGEKVLRAHMDKHNMKKHGIISMESSKEETVKEWEGTQCVSGLETQDGYRVTADCLINDVDAMEYFGSSRCVGCHAN